MEAALVDGQLEGAVGGACQRDAGVVDEQPDVVLGSSLEGAGSYALLEVAQVIGVSKDGSVAADDHVLRSPHLHGTHLDVRAVDVPQLLLAVVVVLLHLFDFFGRPREAGVATPQQVADGAAGFGVVRVVVCPGAGQEAVHADRPLVADGLAVGKYAGRLFPHRRGAASVHGVVEFDAAPCVVRHCLWVVVIRHRC